MENEYLNFIKNLQQIYLEQRDMNRILSSIDRETSWIGTGGQEICESFLEASQALFSEKKEYSSSFTVIDSWYKTRMVMDDVCIIYGEFWAKGKEPDVADLHHRISAVCVKTAKGIKLLHLHMSVPDEDQLNGEYYVKKKIKTENKALRLKFAQMTRDLHDRNQELEILTANIPGGVYQCNNDVPITMVNMSSGFLSLFGYGRDEISSVFKDSYVQMIYESDRKTVIQMMHEQLAQGTTVEFEHRVRCKDGSLMWVLNRGKLVTLEEGVESFFCILIDITKRKTENEKLRLALERHNVIMDQGSDVIFEWDIQADTIDFSSNWEKRFGYIPITSEISTSIPMSNNVHQEDMVCFMKIMNEVKSGIPYTETEVRIRGIAGHYTWCQIRATTQFSNENRPIKAVGVIVDIEKEKNKSNILLEAAQRDALTQLYNKSATMARIESIIKDKGKFHVLMIIDVDNFKMVNDNFGHQCGDAVLLNMAKALKKLFRATDVVGRVGGDEFLIFMANVHNKTLVANKAKEIVRIFSGMPIEIGGELSCSVGISLYPQDGLDYSTLFRCADKALYGVKHEGKVDFSFYDKKSEELSYSPMLTAVNEKIDSEEEGKGIFKQDLIQHIFELLYDAVDMNAVINRILQIVGRTYAVSRVYIFETSEDSQFCSNTFEWCNDGISSEMNNLQNLSFENDITGFFDLYDENDIFYCQNIDNLSPPIHTVLKRQGIVSILQCLIKDGGFFKGYIGFDECTENRYWTKDQIETLSIIANLLSTFLIRQRLKEELAKLKANKNR